MSAPSSPLIVHPWNSSSPALFSRKLTMLRAFLRGVDPETDQGGNFGLH